MRANRHFSSAVNFLLLGGLAAATAALLAGCPKGPRCGNNALEEGETCDDGNNQSGDGCSATCMDEVTCGNGTVDMGEQCDDGAANSDVTADACRTDCMNPSCGDQVVDTMAGETCDPPGPSCSATCTATTGAVCGNSMVEAGEGCDDGNTMPGDGCDASCQPEPFICPTTTPLVCETPVMGTLAAGGVVTDYCVGSGVTIDTEDGAEQVFEFTATATEEVVIQLDGIVGDLDIIISDACDPDACVAVSLNGMTTAEAARFQVTSGTTYFIFVDGYMGGAGAFTLTAGCASTAVCGNSIVDGGEACDDGNAVTGDGCSGGCLPETDSAMCMGDTSTTPPGPVTLVAGTPLMVDLGDVGAATDAGQLSCNVTGVGCSGTGAEIVLEVVMPMGTTDLTMDYDHTGGDELYGVATLDTATCVELECMDPYAVLMGSKADTWDFLGVSDGTADTTVFLIAEACDAGGSTGVATSVTLTAN
jgi:cysteine-rich repeat protein